MAQQYQVDIVTKVQGISSVQALEKALEGIQGTNRKVETSAQGVANSLKKLQGAAAQTAVDSAKASQALAKLRLANAQTGDSVDQATVALRKLQAVNADTATKAAESAKALQKQGDAALQGADDFKKLDKAAAQTTNGIGALGREIAKSFAIFFTLQKAVEALTFALNASSERSTAEKRLDNITESAGEYKAALAAAANISDEFKITQTEATKAIGGLLSRLKPLNYGLKETVEIYRGFNTVAIKAGVTGQQLAAAFLQLSQALGAGRLNGDEFVRISENMPQLLALIAEEMQVLPGELKKLGSEGKITGEVLYGALKKAGEGSVDLSENLTSGQLAQAAFAKGADDLGVALGDVLNPAMDTLQETAGLVFSELAQIIRAAQGLGRAFAFATPAVKGMNAELNKQAETSKQLKTALTSFYKAQLQFIPMYGQLIPLIQKFKDLGGLFNPENARLTRDEVDAILEKYSSLPAKIQESVNIAADFKDIKSASKRVAQELNDVEKALTDELNLQLVDLEEQRVARDLVLQTAKSAAEVEKTVAEYLFDQATTMTDKIKYATAIYDATIAQADIERAIAQNAIESEVAKLDLMASQARLQAEMVETQRQLAAAQGAPDEILAIYDKALKSAREMVTLAEKEAKSGREVAKLRAEAADQLQSQQKAQALLTLQKNLQVSAEQTANQQIRQQINNVKTKIGIEKQLIDLKIKAAKQEVSSADTLKDKLRANDKVRQLELEKLKLQQAEQVTIADLEERKAGLVVDNLQKGEEIVRQKVAEQRATGEVNKAQQAVKDAAEKTLSAAQSTLAAQTEVTAAVKGAVVEETRLEKKAQDVERQQELQKIAQEQTNQRITHGANEMERLARAAERAARANGNTAAFAEGGYVTGPTRAVVGEGGEPEYIIPASKMAESMQRYGAGMRGANVIPDTANVSVNYTGSTVNMGGNSYINKGDVNGIVSQAVNQTLTTLAKSSRRRLEVGLR